MSLGTVHYAHIGVITPGCGDVVFFSLNLSHVDHWAPRCSMFNLNHSTWDLPLFFIILHCKNSACMQHFIACTFMNARSGSLSHKPFLNKWQMHGWRNGAEHWQRALQSIGSQRVASGILRSKSHNAFSSDFIKQTVMRGAQGRDSTGGANIMLTYGIGTCVYQAVWCRKCNKPWQNNGACSGQHTGQTTTAAAEYIKQSGRLEGWNALPLMQHRS